jgi:hypothetical protein
LQFLQTFWVELTLLLDSTRVRLQNPKTPKPQNPSNLNILLSIIIILLKRIHNE